MSGLTFDFSKVSTKFPLAQPSDYVFSIIGAKVEPNKDKTGNNLIVQFESVNPITSKEAAAQGLEGDLDKFKRTKYYPLQKSADSKSSFDPLAAVKLLLMAALHYTEDDARWADLGFNPFDQDILNACLVGKEVILKLGDSKDEPPFGVQTEIKAVRELVAAE